MKESSLDQYYIDKQDVIFISLGQSIVFQVLTNDMFFDFTQMLDHSYNKKEDTYLINPYQKNTKKLKDDVLDFLKKYGKLYPALNSLINFCNSLPQDHFFIIQFHKIEDTELLMKYFKVLTDYHNKNDITLDIESSNFEWGSLLKNYNMSLFGHQRKVIGGGVGKNERLCRFCLTKNENVNKFGFVVAFKNKSHAISESLGNKTVIIKDECDSCNNIFSMGIELSLINYLMPFRSLYGLQGKNGKKQLKGKNFLLDPEAGMHINYDGILPEGTNFTSLESELFLENGFIPQDLYRCLVKFSVSVLPKKELLHLERTVSWIQKEFSSENLPLIARTQHPNFFTHIPLLLFFKKKVIDNSIPDLVGEFHYADQVFVFIIPHNLLDTEDFSDKVIYERWWSQFNSVRPHHEWNFQSFTSQEEVKMQINFKIDGIKLGENAFIEYLDGKDDPVLDLS